jgi:hypothetical protein
MEFSKFPAETRLLIVECVHLYPEYWINREDCTILYCCCTRHNASLQCGVMTESAGELISFLHLFQGQKTMTVLYKDDSPGFDARFWDAMLLIRKP